MKPIFFTKMEGSGNDFLLINNHAGVLNDVINAETIQTLVKKMSDRHLGAGSDGVIFVEQAQEHPFSIKFFNCDGSEVSMCLNGARCVVDYTHRLGLIKEKGKFISPAGPIGFYYKNGTISIEVQPPLEIKLNFSITVNRKKYQAHYLKIGVPHCVLFVDSYDTIDVQELGRAIREHKAFKPEGTNVNFVKVEKGHLFIRTYERGVEDETLSCGSGVLASAYIATKLFIAESPIACVTRGGELVSAIKDKLYLEGPTHYICDGVFYF